MSNLISVGLTPHQLNNLTPLLERKVEKCGCIGAFKGKGSAPKTITLKIETTLDMIGQEMILEKLTLDEKRLEAKEGKDRRSFDIKFIDQKKAENGHKIMHQRGGQLRGFENH